MRASRTACLILGALSLSAAGALADVTIGTVGFDVIPQTAGGIDAASASQYTVTLIDLGTALVNPNTGQHDDRVTFRFMNIGTTVSSITDVYFQDGTLLSLIGASSSSNGTVNFSSPASPPDLPGGQNVDFHTTSQWSADADSPHVPFNGVNNGSNPATAEYVDITFWLQNGLQASDTWAAMHLPYPWQGPHGLRIGIHVQDFDDGGSASFLSEVPLPQTSMLALFGAGGLAIRRRKR